MRPWKRMEEGGCSLAPSDSISTRALIMPGKDSAGQIGAFSV